MNSRIFFAKSFALLTFALIGFMGDFAPPARADWDPKLEAEEEAKRQQARQAEARRKAEVEAQRQQATLKMQRTYLGAAGNGLSDSEVSAAYERKVKNDQANALKAQKEGIALFAEGQKKAAESRDQTNAAMKDMTGKSVDDLMQMSEQELEAFAQEMEQKYGEK